MEKYIIENYLLDCQEYGDLAKPLYEDFYSFLFQTKVAFPTREQIIQEYKNGLDDWGQESSLMEGIFDFFKPNGGSLPTGLDQKGIQVFNKLNKDPAALKAKIFDRLGGLKTSFKNFVLNDEGKVKSLSEIIKNGWAAVKTNPAALSGAGGLLALGLLIRSLIKKRALKKNRELNALYNNIQSRSNNVNESTDLIAEAIIELSCYPEFESISKCFEKGEYND